MIENYGELQKIEVEGNDRLLEGFLAELESELENASHFCEVLAGIINGRHDDELDGIIDLM